ncbi:hypothetical protein AB6A40_002453 [Gnathostoma spinigerum]|uniref:Innexin n=1 Tax=Gnathostoma spinigerum TaxID=75299 RepID=A0ABD6EC71_9BILA
MLDIPLLGKFLSSVSSNRLDDTVDRLHSIFTVTILVLCAMFVGTKQHFGQPIQCMLPAHLDRDSWTAYGQYYCFVESTYRLSYNRTVPNSDIRSKLRATPGVNLNYYQWVPYFFVLQAFCFYAPYWFWKLLQGYSLIDMETAVNEAVSVSHELQFEERQKKIDKLSRFLTTSFDYRHAVRDSDSQFFGAPPNKYSGFCSCLYLLAKFVVVCNNFLQIYLISEFLGADGAFWALKPLAISAGLGHYPFSSQYFPRVTFCDMDRLTTGGIEKNTLQCVIMLNMINEKLFILLWYWIFFLCIISSVSFIYTLTRVITPRYREKSVRFYIQNDDGEENELYLRSDKNRLRDFVHELLGLDGTLMFHFIHEHAGAIVARDICLRMWKLFSSTYQDRRMSNSFHLSEDAVVAKTRPLASAPLASVQPSGGCYVRSSYPGNLEPGGMFTDSEKMAMTPPKFVA